MVLVPILETGRPTEAVNFGNLTVATMASIVALLVGKGVSQKKTDEGGVEQFMDHRGTTQPLSKDRSSYSVLPADWAAALAREGFDDLKVESILAEAYGRPGEKTVLPKRGTVFRAFHLTSLHDVRVVILGMDPYPKAHLATGLAFSVPYTATIPQSLKRIFANLESDPELRFVAPESGDISAWAGSGVLLLNAALTVQEDHPGSDLKIWSDFVSAVLRVLDSRSGPSVFMFWGDDANRVAEEALPRPSHQHLILRSTHPVRESASKFARFSETRPFSEANAFLRSKGHSSVRWEL